MICAEYVPTRRETPSVLCPSDLRAVTVESLLARQQDQVDRLARLKNLRIPSEFDFSSVKGISFESREKFSNVKPETIGQASRIPGVRPTDVALLIGHLRKN